MVSCLVDLCVCAFTNWIKLELLGDLDMFVSFVWVASSATQAMVSTFPLLCGNAQEVGCPAAWFLGVAPT